ncbi:hypothetical protein DL89DRAFT_269339 [Linderina pennispora]|uniref:FAS1 domain-containing protein n=1 Tax=Linderina pennispora TaxID=61395 RepID=A0A1Y1W1W3_9FUNG|nr:uncharacterized protein DL89DRAFT_269339 [Linderina pennispora]ORX67539.1 hypothetical protein DL89DRAFT_269339 [Linderina pennispora]
MHCQDWTWSFVLGWLVVAIALVQSAAAAWPFGGKKGPDDSIAGTRTTTFVDLLSSDARFSEFLHTVQRLRMVIPLNRIRNATLLVPTNEALRRYRKEHDTTTVTGNVYRGVSDFQAWYHLIGDRPVNWTDLVGGDMVWESFSRLTHISGLDPPRNGEHQYGDGRHVEVNGVSVLKTNMSCSAGNVFAIDGLLTLPPTIQGVLRANVADNQAAPTERAGYGDYDFVEKLVAAAGWSYVLDSEPQRKRDEMEANRMRTVWAFTDQAFRDEFGFAERAYLIHGAEFAKDDKDEVALALRDTRLVASQFVTKEPVSLARLGEGEHKVAGFVEGTEHTVTVDAGLSGTVNGLRISKADIIARNGIVHGVESVQRPSGLAFTPQKMLIGLNATLFVRELKDAGLLSYIDGSEPDRKLTLADAFGADLDDGDDMLVEAAQNEYDLDPTAGPIAEWRAPHNRRREWAQYHIVDGQYNVAELAETPLVRTLLASEWTQGKPQVVKAFVDRPHGTARHVSFNGADNILTEPVVVGNTTIYLLSSPMPTPPNLVNALIQDLDLSLFVAAMGASQTASEIQREQGITVLAPVLEAFISLGLVWSYLSLPEDADARSDLSRIVKSHILTKPVYSDEIPMHSDLSADMLTVKTLNGNSVGLYRTPKGIFVAAEQIQDPQALKKSTKHHISEPDMLLRTGVAHVLERGLIMPPNVDITSSKLLRGMKAHVFLSLLERFNLTHVLEAPPPAPSVPGNDSTKSSDGDSKPVVGYSLLVASDKAWRENAAYREMVRRDQEEDRHNPWRNSTNKDIEQYLEMLVRLHVIPVTDIHREPGERLPASDLTLSDRKTYVTLLEGAKLRAYEFATDRFSLQLDGIPFYQSPGGIPFISYATIVRAGYGRSGAVFELDSALKLPPKDLLAPGGWKKAYWWTRADYQSL